MMVYPAYTVARIEDELSWRQVKLLVNCWKEEKPLIVMIDRLEKALLAHVKHQSGIVFQSAKQTDDNLLQGLSEMGFM